MARNGELNRADLVLVDGWAYLERRTAAAWNAGCDKLQRLGYARPSITAPDGAYRDLAGQVYWRTYWCNLHKCGNAAPPGYSNHGWARAADIFKVYLWPRAILRSVFQEMGFIFDVPSEDWHMRHDGREIPGYAQTAGSTPYSTIPIQEDDMYTDADRARDNATATTVAAIHAALFTTDPTSRGSSAGVLSVLGKLEQPIIATRDGMFLATETSFGTPGGVLKSLREILDQLEKARAE